MYAEESSTSSALMELQRLEGDMDNCDDRNAKKQSSSFKQSTLKTNRAFFDIYPSHRAPLLGYIHYTTKHSFDAREFLERVRSIDEKDIKVYIKAYLEVPKEIHTKKVYIDSGDDYYYKGWDGERYIVYNGISTTHHLGSVLVDVKEDAEARRYVSFIITIIVAHPDEIKDASNEIVPNKYFFKIAPNRNGYKKLYRNVSLFIVEE